METMMVVLLFGIAVWAVTFGLFLILLSVFEVFWKRMWGGHDDKYPREYRDMNPMAQFTDDELVELAAGFITSEQQRKLNEWHDRHGWDHE